MCWSDNDKEAGYENCGAGRIYRKPRRPELGGPGGARRADGLRPHAAELVRERIGDAEAVYTNKVPLPREVIEDCSALRFIGVLATGYNVVDVAAARERGIPVCNVPTYGTAAVGQYAIAMLLEICHHVAHHSEAVHAGRWQQGPTGAFGTIR